MTDGNASSNEERKQRRSGKRRVMGSEGEGNAEWEGGRESSGGVSGKRVRMDMGAASGMGSGGSGRGKRKAEGSGAQGRSAVMYRASAAVIGSLEKRMQEAGDGSREQGRSGSKWFERGEGGGVT